MANAIKYSTGSETLALKKGNFYIGTGDVGKGPTSTTGYYNGITPPSGGYTVYLNKASGGPSIYTCANDTELISLTNQIAGTSYTTVNECFTYFVGQTDKMVLNRDYEGIVTDGLVLNVDAGFTPSYPKNGTTWYDVGGGYNGTLTNGPTFSTDGEGSIVFDGIDDEVTIPINSVFNTSSVTFEVWANLQTINDRHILYVNWAGNSLEVYSGRNVIMYNYSSSGGQLGAGTSSGVFNWDTWTHFVGTYDDASQTLKTYVNGVLLGTRTSTPSTSYSVYAHKISGTNFGGEVKGKISIVRHYNKALSLSEIQQNYNAQKGRFGL